MVNSNPFLLTVKLDLNETLHVVEGLKVLSGLYAFNANAAEATSDERAKAHQFYKEVTALLGKFNSKPEPERKKLFAS